MHMGFRSNFWYIRLLILIKILLVSVVCVSGQDDYRDHLDYIQSYDFSLRPVPQKPSGDQKIRIIIDTDAKNEVDDQWAIALALLSSDMFEIEGFVAANFDNSHGGPRSIDKSYDEILLLLEKAGMKGKFPVFKGSPPMRYRYAASGSEGVDFIIQTALESTPGDPVWIVALGSATNLASAYLQNPEIASTAVFFWHGRTRWPDKCWNFNVFGDRNAAMTLFHSPIPFILFDTGTYLYCPMEESEAEVRPYGELGKYLHDVRKTGEWYQRPDKGFFDLGDIAALVDPDLATWEVVDCPEVAPDLTYKFTGRKGKILRCYDIDRDGTFGLLYERLKSMESK
jgi:purine nucleosidase